MDEYEVIYSLTCHESPDCVVDLLKNIRYYNRTVNYAVVIKMNNAMYDHFERSRELDQFDNIIVNDFVFTSKAHTYDLAEAQISNFNKVKSKSFKYFCQIASNCLFKKELTSYHLDNEIKETLPEKIPNEHLNNWNINQKLSSLFKEMSIELYNYQHEGALYEKEQFEKIANFCEKFDLKNKVEHNIAFEEVIFTSLDSYFHKYVRPRICKVFWDMPAYTPTIEQIEQENLFMVKRIGREYNNPLRKYIRDYSNQYEV
jgi:hypothetical protein